MVFSDLNSHIPSSVEENTHSLACLRRLDFGLGKQPLDFPEELEEIRARVLDHEEMAKICKTWFTLRGSGSTTYKNSGFSESKKTWEYDYDWILMFFSFPIHHLRTTQVTFSPEPMMTLTISGLKDHSPSNQTWPGNGREKNGIIIGTYGEV